MNPIVDVIAEELFKAENKEQGVLQAWSRATAARRQGYQERVAYVLLAALNAGYVLTRAPELEKGSKAEEEPVESI